MELERLESFTLTRVSLPRFIQRRLFKVGFS